MEEIEDIDQIFNFYQVNYVESGLAPDRESIKNCKYYGIMRDNGIVALVGVSEFYNKIAEIFQLVVVKQDRNKGYGIKLMRELEKEFQARNFNKILTWILTDNFPCLFGAMKEGYFIEGLARENLENTDVYLLGKKL